MPEPHFTEKSGGTEAVANKFFAMADKAHHEEAQHPHNERHKEDLLTSVARETAQGNLKNAQSVLETGTSTWDDNLRAAASEMNRLEQQRTGAKPLSFQEAQKAIEMYARDLEKISKSPGGRQQDLEQAMLIDDVVADTTDPGLEGINSALKYIEGAIKSSNHAAEMLRQSRGPTSHDALRELITGIEKKRSIRDALFAEKQARTERQQVREKLRPTRKSDEEIEALRRRLELVMPSRYPDASKEKPLDAKIKFGSVLNKFTEQLRDGTVPQLFEGFIQNHPSQQEYEVMATQLNGLYKDYMKDLRAPSDKIPEFKSKLVSASRGQK